MKIYETRSCMLHAKGIIIDGEWAMFGSANFDNRSFFLNFEINLATTDAETCGKISDLFETWASEAHLMTKEELKYKPFAKKLFEAMLRTLSPVL